MLYVCLFSSLLYSVEAWGDVKQFEDKLIKIERETLKRCFGVKSGTSNDLVRGVKQSRYNCKYKRQATEILQENYDAKTRRCNSQEYMGFM